MVAPQYGRYKDSDVTVMALNCQSYLRETSAVKRTQ